MKYLKVFTDLYKALRPFSYAEKGRLFDATLIYAESGEEPELTGNERYIWPTIKADVDRQREAYRHQCEVNKVNITNRYEPLRTVTNGNESYQEKTKEKTKTEEKEGTKKRVISAPRFTPPSVSEVREYCQERGNAVDAERFVDFYSAKGWMVGKNHMKDWRAAVRTWERDERSTPAPEQKPSAEMEAWLRGEID